MKTLLYIAIFTFLFSAAAYPQQDTLYKNLKIRGTEIEVGKFYRIILTNGYFFDAKLKGITDKEILVIIDNETTEYNIAEIEKVIPQKFFFIPENSSSYNVSKRNSRPMMYFSLGYAKRMDDWGENIYKPSESYKGFSIYTGFLFRINKYLGNIIDVSYIHFYGEHSNSSLGTPGGNYYKQYDYNYGDANDIFFKSGLGIGYLDNESKFNAYIVLGFIFGFEIGGDDILKEYVYEKNINTSTNVNYVTGLSGFRIGAFGSLRLNYKFTKDLYLFTEGSSNIVEKKAAFFSNFSVGFGYQF
jgi:hypothetical protein